MSVELRVYSDYYEPELLALYDSVGWTNYVRHPKRLQPAYAGSLYTLAAYDGDTLVGIVRCVGDGVSIIYVQDLLVRPDYQRRGIGTSLLHAVMDHYAEVYQFVLLTDSTEKTVAFYRSLGFTRDNDLGCCAFLRMRT